MSFVGAIGQGFGGSASRFMGQTRGRVQGSPQQGVNYPSPFFDVAHTYLPVTIKQLFRWCRYYFLTNPLINATVFKLSEYPVTDLIIDHPDSKVRNRWEEYFQDHLRFRSMQVEFGLDYHCYGNTLVSMGFPFKKYLKCKGCRFNERADKIRQHWTFTTNAFRLNCPQCGLTSEAEATDVYYKNASGINVIRWNCEHVEVNYNDATADTTHFYTIPPTVRNDIVIGKKDIVEGVPQVFIQAIRQQKGIVFSKDNLFHMKRATLAQQDRGWGIPLILPVLKDTFYLQIMKKAQEAILLEHIVPLRVLFPQAGSGSSDPYCVSPETLVETPLGLQPAAEVGEGDYLRSHTGAWRRVEATKRRKIAAGEKVYQFKVASLAAFPFEVSEEHPILAVPKTNRRGRMTFVDPEFIPAKDLKKGDYVAYPIKSAIRPHQMLDLAEYIPSRAHTEDYVYRRLSRGAAEVYEWLQAQKQAPGFGWGERKAFLAEHGWSEEDYATAHAMYGESKLVDRVYRYLPVSAGLAKLVGYYLAEGCPKGPCVSFALHLREKDVADEIEYIVKGLGFRGVSHHERPEQNGRSVDIEDVLLSELLMSLCGVGFAKKRIPDVISEAPDNLVLEMLSGLFTGDGCDFQTTTNRVALKLANPSMILEARRLFLRFGLIGGTIKEDPTETSLHRTASYHLNFNGDAADVVRSLFKNSLFKNGETWIQNRAQKSGLIRGDYVLLRINDIQEVSDVPEVIGFQMRGDKSFCVAGVATHNTTINLMDWRDHVASEIARWRYDNNYIPILPLPIGNQTIGGDGRALLLTQEIQTWSEQIMVGMGVPKEFLLGGMSYAGTNVSMRMLENAFIGYIIRQKQLANWVMQRVSAYMGWPMAAVRFKPFKMADDLQRKAYNFQLNQANKMSDTTLLADSDLDQEAEDELMVRETDKRNAAMKMQQLAMATVQGEASLIMAKYQAKAQQVTAQIMATGPAPGEPGAASAGAMGAPAMPSLPAGQPGTEGASGIPQEAQSGLSASQGMNGQPGGGGVDINQMAQMLAEQYVTLGPDEQQMAMENLQAQSPELAQLVQQAVAKLQASGAGPHAVGGAVGAAAQGVDTRPLPEQRGPRREAALV